MTPVNPLVVNHPVRNVPFKTLQEEITALQKQLDVYASQMADNRIHGKRRMKIAMLKCSCEAATARARALSFLRNTNPSA